MDWYSLGYLPKGRWMHYRSNIYCSTDIHILHWNVYVHSLPDYNHLHTTFLKVGWPNDDTGIIVMINFILWVASSERDVHLPHTALPLTVVHADHVTRANSVQCWTFTSSTLRRLCDGVNTGPLLHTGGSDVDGGRGIGHVSEIGDHLCSTDEKVYYYPIHDLLG